MNEKETFLKEMGSCKGPFYHIIGNIDEPSLKEVDKIYGAADRLSIENAKKHKYILLALSILGPLISFAFLIYDEGEVHSLIIVCILLLIFLFLIQKQANKLDCHRKFLEYRVLAESLRLQFFLSYAGLNKRVEDLLPWFIKKGIPWIEDILRSLPISEVKEKKSIVYFWILDQKTYHEEALVKAEKRKARDERISRIVIFITIMFYVLGLLFELYMYFYSPNIDPTFIRIILKVVIGSMSVGALFIESYYGKMSLTETINDHKRMISLYRKVERMILEQGETEELILYLAREFLVENSTWYAYQSKNKAELVL